MAARPHTYAYGGSYYPPSPAPSLTTKEQGDKANIGGSNIYLQMF